MGCVGRPIQRPKIIATGLEKVKANLEEGIERLLVRYSAPLLIPIRVEAREATGMNIHASRPYSSVITSDRQAIPMVVR